jgi:hypothetical protein
MRLFGTGPQTAPPQVYALVIERLVNGEGGDSGDAGPGSGPGSDDGLVSAAERLEAEQASILRGMPAGLLAGELERGWTVSSPF